MITRPTSLNRASEPNRGPIALPLRRRFTLYGIALGVWLTGVLWLIYHYFLRQEGPFGFKNNPLEHLWIVLHAAFGFAAIWMFGVLWSVHVKHAWELRWRRRSGGTLFGFVLALSLTGYA